MCRLWSAYLVNHVIFRLENFGSTLICVHRAQGWKPRSTVLSKVMYRCTVQLVGSSFRTLVHSMSDQPLHQKKFGQVPNRKQLDTSSPMTTVDPDVVEIQKEYSQNIYVPL